MATSLWWYVMKKYTTFWLEILQTQPLSEYIINMQRNLKNILLLIPKIGSWSAEYR